ncbi:MAG: hypothetical protein KJ941_05690 [Bacteroidetes bacterium]|nr:hypothetical protein [Bacteroidota bacterium]
MRKILFKIINSVPFIGNVYWKRYFNKEVTKSWEAETVVLVYQMGKVGSSTLTKSINQSGQKISAFHIHFLATLKNTKLFLNKVEYFHITITCILEMR